jgi:hypothetical protein
LISLEGIENGHAAASKPLAVQAMKRLFVSRGSEPPIAALFYCACAFRTSFFLYELVTYQIINCTEQMYVYQINEQYPQRSKKLRV